MDLNQNLSASYHRNNISWIKKHVSAVIIPVFGLFVLFWKVFSPVSYILSLCVYPPVLLSQPWNTWKLFHMHFISSLVLLLFRPWYLLCLFWTVVQQIIQLPDVEPSGSCIIFCSVLFSSVLPFLSLERYFSIKYSLIVSCIWAHPTPPPVISACFV